MMPATTRELRGWLRLAYADAVANPPRTLLEQLLLELRTAANLLKATNSGIKRVRTKDHEMENFAASEGAGADTAKGTFTAYEYLIDLHDEVLSALGGSAIDADIYAEMLDQLVAVFEVEASTYANLRC